GCGGGDTLSAARLLKLCQSVCGHDEPCESTLYRCQGRAEAGLLSSSGAAAGAGGAPAAAPVAIVMIAIACASMLRLDPTTVPATAFAPSPDENGRRTPLNARLKQRPPWCRCCLCRRWCRS